jgi:hypothetical protein
MTIKMDVWRRKSGEPFRREAESIPATGELRAATDTALVLVREINVLLGVANESKVFNTKAARLASAKQKLDDLRRLVSAHPHITITNLINVEKSIATLVREMADWKYEPDDAWPEWVSRAVMSADEHTDYRMATWRAHPDIIVGLQFVATMNPWVPLRVLLRHGELHSDMTRLPPGIAHDGSEGTWVSKMCSFRSMGIPMDEPPPGMMASTIGPIPSDGGDFLKFLIVVREIVESDRTVDARACRLQEELTCTFWCKFVSSLGGEPSQLVSMFFPYMIDTIPGLTMLVRDAFERLGLNTAAKVAATLDIDLLGIKGIGPAKLKAIREWQIQVAEPNATRLDRVLR